MTSPFLRCGCSSQSDLSASSPAAGNKNININNNINSNINININIRSGWGGEQDETGRRFDICLWCHCHYCVNVSCLEPLDHTKQLLLYFAKTLLIHIDLLNKSCDHLLLICRLLIVLTLDHKNSFALSWICKKKIPSHRSAQQTLPHYPQPAIVASCSLSTL